MRILGPDSSKGKKKVSTSATEPRSKTSKLSKDCVEKRQKSLVYTLTLHPDCF